MLNNMTPSDGTLGGSTYTPIESLYSIWRQYPVTTYAEMVCKAHLSEDWVPTFYPPQYLPKRDCFFPLYVTCCVAWRRNGTEFRMTSMSLLVVHQYISEVPFVIRC